MHVLMGGARSTLLFINGRARDTHTVVLERTTTGPGAVGGVGDHSKAASHTSVSGGRAETGHS